MKPVAPIVCDYDRIVSEIRTKFVRPMLNPGAVLGK